MKDPGTRGFEERLLRPFDALTTPTTLGAGLIAMILTAWLADQGGLQTRGILELQFIAGGSWPLLIIQGLINWLSLSLSLGLAARWLVDAPFSIDRLLATQALARWPLLLSAMYLNIPGLGQQIHKLTQGLIEVMPTQAGQVMADATHLGDALVLTLLSVPLLVFLLWTLWLMFHGYQIVTRLSGPRAAFSFAAALAVAYTLSKGLMLLLP